MVSASPEHDNKTEVDRAEAMKLAKVALRKSMSAALQQLTTADLQTQSNIVFQKLKSHPIYQCSTNISIYISMPTCEIVTDDIIRHALENGKNVFVPQFCNKTKSMRKLKLADVQDFDNMPTIKWGIRQPPFDEVERENGIDASLDIILMPGVAFTKSGNRLGHGAGFYDSYLHKYEAHHGRLPYTMALALKEQIIDNIPMSDRDVKLDSVLVGE